MELAESVRPFRRCSRGDNMGSNQDRSTSDRRRPRPPQCCSVCGFKEKAAIHLPPYGAPADAAPWGHAFLPNKSRALTP